MLISVVIVTKGERDYSLRDCIFALSRQSIRDFEIILILPKDKILPFEEAVVSGFNRIPPTLKQIRQNGMGISNARNRGVKASKGEIIAFTDDDAEPHPDWLEKIAHHFKGHPELDYLGGEFTMEPKNIWQRWVNTRYHIKNPDGGLCHGNNMAYRRNVFANHKFDERIMFGADESEFQKRLQDEGFKGRTFQDILVRHQHRDSFLSFSKMRIKYAQGHVYIIEEKLKQSLFHWNDLFIVAMLFTLLNCFFVPSPWTVALFLSFASTFMLKLDRGQSLSFWMVDIYVQLLWSLSKMYYSLKHHLKR